MFVFVQLFGNGATFFFAKKMEMIRRFMSCTHQLAADNDIETSGSH